MQNFIDLAETIIVQRLVSDHAPLSRSTKLTGGLGFLIGLTAIIGVGFILAAAYIHFMAVLPLAEAQLSFGLLLLGLAALGGLIMGLYHSYKNKCIRQQTQRIKNDILDTLDQADKELGQTEFMQNNPKSALLLSSLVGYALANTVSHKVC